MDNKTTNMTHADILETISDAINLADKTSISLGDRLYEVMIALKEEWGIPLDDTDDNEEKEW